MLKIAVCDDEISDRQFLSSLISLELELEGYLFTIDEFENGEEFLRSQEKLKQYDLIFMDIEMSGRNGVDTAKEFRKYNETALIIFITGYSEYVFDGYEVHAFNYVLKPYTKEKLINILKKALPLLQNNKKRIFSFETTGTYYQFDYSEIRLFESDKRKVRIYVKDHVYEFYRKLNDIEQICGFPFIRIHQRYLVNLKYVDSVSTTYLMLDNEKYPISRQEYQKVVIAFAKYILNE